MRARLAGLAGSSARVSVEEDQRRCRRRRPRRSHAEPVVPLLESPQKLSHLAPGRRASLAVDSRCSQAPDWPAASTAPLSSATCCACSRTLSCASRIRTPSDRPGGEHPRGPGWLGCRWDEAPASSSTVGVSTVGTAHLPPRPVEAAWPSGALLLLLHAAKLRRIAGMPPRRSSPRSPARRRWSLHEEARRRIVGEGATLIPSRAGTWWPVVRIGRGEVTFNTS